MSILLGGGADMSFKISWKLHLLSILMTFSIYFLMKNCVINMCTVLLINNMIYRITGNIFFDNVIFLSLILIPINVVHELLHGCVYRVFSGKLKYGFNGVYAYTLEITGIALQRTRFLLVLLAPVTVISLISLFIPGVISSLIFILNLTGSTGDILMALYLCKLDNESYIIDRKYGFDVIKKNDFNDDNNLKAD